MNAVLAALRRFGGVLLAPRQTVAALPPDVGEADGWILSVLYVAAVGTYALVEGLAGVVATGDLSAFIMLASVVGRLMIGPVLVLVAAETLLGAHRGHRRGLALVPMLAVVALGGPLAAFFGVAVPSLTLQLTGGIAGLALTWWLRPAVPSSVSVAPAGAR